MTERKKIEVNEVEAMLLADRIDRSRALQERGEAILREASAVLTEAVSAVMRVPAKDLAPGWAVEVDKSGKVTGISLPQPKEAEACPN